MGRKQISVWNAFIDGKYRLLCYVGRSLGSEVGWS